MSSVLLLCSPDVDSVCATRMLTTLFIQDDIPHRIVPVEGYRSLMTTLASHGGDTDVKSIVCINLGAVLSLPSMVTLPPGCIMHIIDSHRPWNLDNLFATSENNDRIWCWDDGDVLSKLCRPSGERDAFERLEFDLDDDSSDDDSSDSSVSGQDDDDDDDEQDAAGKRKRTPSSRSSSGSSSASSSHRRSRRKRTSAQLSNAERHRLRTLLTRYYNRGESFGMSVSSMMYVLCEHLGRADRESLWLAIVGLTSLYLAQQIDAETYDVYSAAYASEAFAMEPGANSHGERQAWSNDLLPDRETGKAASGANRAVAQAISTNARAQDADDTSIRLVPSELRFVLYRHWSLETSMYHTAYVASKLGIWRERGLSKLRGLMAKMGFSLTAVRQNYTHMPLDLRRSLVAKLQAIAPEYGLTELTYRGFERSFGFHTAPLGASDVVEGVSALLVAAHGVKIDVETPGMAFASATSGNGSSGAPLRNSFAANAAAPGTAQGSELFATKRLWNLGSLETPALATADDAAAAVESSEAREQLDRTERSVWVSNFFEAYRSLDPQQHTSVDLLRSSLLLAQSLHRKIVQRGISMITNQTIRTLKNFRLAILKDGADLELFANVDVLSNLGTWLSTSLRDIIVDQQQRNPKASSKTTTAPLPFILAALDVKRDSFIVVGQTASVVHGQVEHNHFTHAFTNAARLSAARVRHDRFQTFSIQVRKSDLAAFVEKVHLKFR